MAALLPVPQEPSGFCLLFRYSSALLTARSHSALPPLSRSFCNRSALLHRLFIEGGRLTNPACPPIPIPLPNPPPEPALPNPPLPIDPPSKLLISGMSMVSIGTSCSAIEDVVLVLTTFLIGVCLLSVLRFLFFTFCASCLLASC